MGIVEDNTFDFLVRDCLKKECEERGISLSGDPTRDQLMLDMITYCSRGNKEEAVCNLTATKEFIVGFQHVQRRLPGGWWWADPNGWEFMFELKKIFHQNQSLSSETGASSFLCLLGGHLERVRTVPA